jgi:hypothetical protein
MKKTFLTLSVLIFVIVVNGQDLKQDTAKKTYKNLIGIDVSGLVRYYNGYSFNSSTSPYMIIYKRICCQHAFRFGIGGTVSSNSYNQNDSVGSKSNSQSFNIGLGYEHYNYVAKKWGYYFGADAIGYYSRGFNQNDYSSTNNRKTTNSSFRYGASPLFGIVFKFNKRISLATETSYDLTFIQSKSEYKYTPNSSNDYTTKSKGFQTSYHSPSLLIRVLF